MPDSSSALTRLVDSFRNGARTEWEKGRYSEELALVYCPQDAKQTNCYERVLRYAEWVLERGRDTSDTSIAPVAKLRGEDGCFAIQSRQRFSRQMLGLRVVAWAL